MKKWQNFTAKAARLISHNQFILYLGVFITAFLIYLLIQSSPTFLDPDSFYHLKIIKLIGESGPVINFPWLQFTVLKDYYIDHHFLYHVIGIPFVRLLGDFAGIKFYTVLLNSLFILLAYSLLKKDKVKFPGIYALLLLTANGLLFRISLTKASAFSLILLFLGTYCLFWRKKWLLFFLSWAYVWSYGGFLLIWAMTGFFCVSDGIEQTFSRHKGKKVWRRFGLLVKSVFSAENCKLILAAICGVISGVIVNPYFPRNINFVWEQLVQIGVINYRGTVNVGGEWYPMKISELFSNCGAAIILSMLALVLFIAFIKKVPKQNYFFFLSSLFFLFFTLKSKRYIEYFVPQLVFFIAYSYNYFLTNFEPYKIIREFKKFSKIIAVLINILAGILVIFLPMIMANDVLVNYRSFRKGYKMDTYAGVSQYLLEHSKEGEIVMHTDWDDFPHLFYRNSHNYYIVGLDPTFMYNYDRELYQLYADITMAKIDDNLARLISENFHARYFIVQKGRDRLRDNLQKDPNFIKVFEDRDAWLYMIK